MTPQSREPNSGASVASERSVRAAAHLARLQTRHPLWVLSVSAVLTVVGLFFATKLTIQPGFESLLPESRKSVQELRRVASRTSGISIFFIVLQAGPNTQTEALRKAADALVPELEKLGPPWVGSAESGMHEALHFLGPRAGLFADKGKLEKLRDDIEARYTYEVNKATGTLLEDDPPPALTRESLKRDLGISEEQTDRYPDGYYQSKDGKNVVVTVRSKVFGTDFQNGTEAIRRIREVVDRVNPRSFDPQITVGFAGDLQTAISEYTSINRDLTEVGITGAFLIATVVLLYYMRFRTIITMLLTISIGVAWTFGMTELLVGKLNMATGFLFTIVAGNGINFGIIFMARYLEARRKGEPLFESITTAHHETWLPTLTAGVAAAASYGSLVVTDFRGFHDFGLIGGVGMLLCWTATYWTLPSILAVAERISPLDRAVGGVVGRIRQSTRGGLAFGAPFAKLVERAPRAILVAGVFVSAVSFGASLIYVRSDPMEYDLKNLRNDVSARREEIRLSKLADAITGHVSSDGMAILVDRLEQVAPLQQALAAKLAAAPANAKPFRAVHALQDFVPDRQSEKIPLLLDIKKRIIRAQKRGLFSEADWAKIKELLPPDDIKPFGIGDLPAGVARAFTETDGTRGRIVYISPTESETVDDAHYLFRWADAYRETKLPDGSTVVGSGRAVIYADIWSSVVDDVPPAIVVSLAATILAVIFAFRVGWAALYVLGALLVGITWMMGLMVLLKVKLNFLNFIALPITFGIGVDYAVNVVQRYVREGAGGALTAVRETGGAVILCSLTTSLGYLALVRSMNFAVRSLGIAAVLGEVACLLAAVLVLPAALVWLDRRRAGKASATPAEADEGLA